MFVQNISEELDLMTQLGFLLTMYCDYVPGLNISKAFENNEQ